MPKIYAKDANSILSDVVRDFEVIEDYRSAEAVVCWNDIEGECREIILNANYEGIPTLVAQHGLRATREYSSPFNAPLITDKIMVWGPKDKERLIQSGVDENRVIITGTTLFDHLIPRIPHKGFNIVFSPMHWDTTLDENLMVANKLREIKGINVFTKLIDDMDGTHFDNPIYSNRSMQNHLKICASVLSTADLIVGINESTFEFLAYKLDIPVIIVKLWEPKFFGNRLFFSDIGSFFSNACQKIELKNLENEIFNTLDEPEKFSSERRTALYEEAGVGYNKLLPKDRIINAINDSITQGHELRRLLSPNEIIENASTKLLEQISSKNANSQQILSKIKSNLEEIKQAKQNSIIRISTKVQLNSIGFNPLDYPICFSYPLRLDSSSGWVEHIPFGMFIIDILNPKILVELGTHTGVSYSTFCQAVKKLGTSTNCYAIDSWQGDLHSGLYGPDILTDLRNFHDPLYSDFSRLMPSTFDDAIKFFPDNTIDLLHIDGFHTYEAVKHDFETWLPKVSSQGIILLHDTNVRERDFGVWRLWEELKLKYPYFEFYHGNGLGILAVGKDYSPSLEFLLESSEYTSTIREYFYQLGFRLNEYLIKITERDQIIKSLKEEIVGYESSRSWRITRPLRKINQLIQGFIGKNIGT